MADEFVVVWSGSMKTSLTGEEGWDGSGSASMIEQLPGAETPSHIYGVRRRDADIERDRKRNKGAARRRYVKHPNSHRVISVVVKDGRAA